MKKERNIRPWQVVKIRFTKVFIYSWFWDWRNRCHVLEFLYWRYMVDDNDQTNPQVSAVRAFGIWAGFMSEGRGLSWDRKSRYGKK